MSENKEEEIQDDEEPFEMKQYLSELFGDDRMEVARVKN